VYEKSLLLELTLWHTNCFCIETPFLSIEMSPLERQICYWNCEKLSLLAVLPQLRSMINVHRILLLERVVGIVTTVLYGVGIRP